MLSLALTLAMLGAQAGALRIVVIEGEDAVNIVQQKTAVAPVVEVRDRNNQPVAGAVVRFAIQQGRGTFAGARTLAVTTNAAGRAVATGLTPTGGGALQIGASATFQGQTVVATITQTNVMTAAEAAAAGAGGTSGTATTGGAAGGGGGGGISGTTLGIVGGAAAAGAAVAVAGSAGGDEAASVTTTYRGGFALSAVYNNVTRTNGVVTGFCGPQPVSINGTVTVTLNEKGAGSIEMEWTETVGAAGFCDGIAPGFKTSGMVTNSANISVSVQYDNDYSSLQGTIHLRRTGMFSGALSGDEIVGTVTMTEDHTLVAPAAPNITSGGGFPPATGSVTLTKQ